MYIHGSFINREGATIEVHILTEQDRSTELEIGADGSGLYFADEAVQTEGEINDTFDVLLPQSATIRLLARSYIPDFFCSTCRDAVVNILRDGSCLFAGFIEPMAFSQDYNELYDELELSCIDALSALQYSLYKDIGTASMPYATAKRQASERDFATIIKEMLDGVTAGLDITGTLSARYLYDGSRAADSTEARRYTIFADLSISELLFMGDEEDDTWTQQAVLEEMLRYLNLHIAQEGLTFRIFSWESVKGTAAIEWRELAATTATAETTERQTVEIGLANVADCATQISVGEVYNRLLLTCDTESVEDLIESPLDDDLLSPAFSGYQLYCKEMSRPAPSKITPSTTSYDEFKKMVFGDETRSGDEGYTRDWYMQVMRNSAWRFPSNPAKESGDIYNTYCSTGKNQQELLAYLGAGGHAAIVAFHSEEMAEADRGKSNAPTAHFSLTNYLIVPVGGNGDDTESGAYPTEASLLARCPRAIYTGATSGGVLSPADAATTNYIVLSGKLLLCPLLEMTNTYAYLHDTFEWPAWCEVDDDGNLYNFVYERDDFKRVENKDGTRFYTREYFEAETPTATPTADKESGDRINCLPITDGKQLFEFKYSAVGDSSDHISKVAVLACMLVVGDQCVVETGTDGQPSDFSWQPYKELSECSSTDEYYSQCFYIGFDPDKGDYLIGGEFEFQNNIDHTMNIDATGIAIPIKNSDKVSGQVKFKILGPVNVMWDEITRRHKTWFRRTKWTTTSKPLLSHVSSIILESFEMKVYSDNGKLSSIGDSDIIYMSDTDETYTNKKDDITFKICSALTTDERQSLGVSDSVSLSTPKTAATGNAALSVYDTASGETAKPEQLYVDAYYNEYHTPRVEMEQNFREPAATIDRFTHYSHPAMGKTFFVEAISRDLSAGEAKVKMKEI